MDHPVQLSEDAFATAKRIADQHGIPLSKYIEDLIYFDEDARSGVLAEHEKLLIETLEKSEPSTPLTKVDFDELRQHARQVAAASAAKRASA